MENKFGKTSKLMIKAGLKDEQTILKDAFFSAPFKIMHPFYQNKDFMTIMCLTASAGIMEGDEQEYFISVEEGGKLEFVSQSYEKIHKMNSGSASRKAELHVARGACLYYNPLPTLPFKDSAFKSELKVYLEDNSSKFILKEILSAGRCSRGETFEYRYYDNQIQIYEADRIIYADNLRFEPAHMALESIGMYESYTHLGTLVMCHFPNISSYFEKVRDLLDNTPDIEGGITALSPTSIIVRVLGIRGEKIESILDKILGLYIN